MDIDKKAKSIEEIIELSKELSNNGDKVWFRGHNEYIPNVKLIPSLYRLPNNQQMSPEQVKEKNKKLAEYAHSWVPSMTLWSFCQYAQQILNNSFMLDITDNIEIASFFACNQTNRYTKKYQENKKNGSILMIVQREHDMSLSPLNL